MKLLNNLLFQLRQLGLSADEYAESVNPKDRATRLQEMRGYHRLAGMALEKLEDESFRKNPKFAAKRAVLRNNGQFPASD